MKEQYVGDVSDYRKYALLRALSAGGANRIGVCWMLTPSDGSMDGRKRAYLGQPERYRQFDPELFELLAGVASDPDRRRLQHIEENGAIPGAGYFNAFLSDNAAERQTYMAECRAAMADADLVFFDPDNGLEVKLPRIGHKGSSKFLYEAEVCAWYSAGKSILVYQHFPFIQRDVFIASCIDRLRAMAPDAVIGTFRTAHVVFLLLIHPQAQGKLTVAARAATSRWDAKFISGRLFDPMGTAASADASSIHAEEPREVTSASAAEPSLEAPEAAKPPARIESAEAEPSRPSLLRRLIGRLR